MSKVWIAVALAAALVALVVVAFTNMGENLVYYWTPSQLHEAGEDAEGATVRLGGMVKTGSVDWSPDSQDLRFVVHDGTAEVTVHGQGLPPQMFRENIGVVVEGRLGGDGVFTSDRLLVKHDNTYAAPEHGEDIDVEAMYRQMEAGGS